MTTVTHASVTTALLHVLTTLATKVCVNIVFILLN